MKKILSLFVILLFTFTLSGCNKKEDQNINSNLPTPTDLVVEDGKLSFLVITNESVTVEGVTYTVYIDDVTTDKTNYKVIEGLTDFPYELPELPDNKLFEVRVQSAKGEEYSIKSNALVINTFVELETLYATHNTLESGRATILGVDSDSVLYITYGKMNNSKLNANSYDLERSVLSIDHSSLSNDSTLTFFVYTPTGYHKVEVNKVDVEVPTIYSPNQVSFNDSDLYFQLNLAGGEFVEINGSEIGSSDYKLIENTLIIDEDFISDLFEANESRTTVILSYQLKTGDDVVIGYLFIDKE